MILIDAKNMRNIFQARASLNALAPESEEDKWSETIRRFQAPIEWVTNEGKKKSGL